MRQFQLVIASATFGLALAGSAHADDTRVPITGSAQGVIVPNALPGGQGCSTLWWLDHGQDVIDACESGPVAVLGARCGLVGW